MIADNYHEMLSIEKRLFPTYSTQEMIDVARSHEQGCIISNSTDDDLTEWIRFIYPDNSMLMLDINSQKMKLGLVA